MRTTYKAIVPSISLNFGLVLKGSLQNQFSICLSIEKQPCNTSSTGTFLANTLLIVGFNNLVMCQGTRPVIAEMKMALICVYRVSKQLSCFTIVTTPVVGSVVGIYTSHSFNGASTPFRNAMMKNDWNQLIKLNENILKIKLFSLLD